MMKKLLYIVYASLFLITFSFAQNKIVVSPNFGGYIYNSENDTYILGSEKLRSFWGFEIAYRHIKMFGYPVEISYSYSNVKSPGALDFIQTDAGGSQIAAYSGEFYLQSNLIDLNIQENSGLFTYGIGPTIGIFNRGYKITLPNTAAESVKKDINEDLLSYAVGANALIDFEIPLNTAQTYSLLIGAKFRYTHSIIYDKQGRNLDNYNQDFLSGSLNVGFGFNL